jgi:hypothetical protein
VNTDRGGDENGSLVGDAVVESVIRGRAEIADGEEPADGIPDRPGPALKQFTKSVLETALNEEMTEHLGHAKHRAPKTGTPPTSATAPDRRPS